MKKLLIFSALLGSIAAVSALPTWEPFVNQTANGVGSAYAGANGGSNLAGQTNASGEFWFDWNEGSSNTNVIVTNFNWQTMPFASGYSLPAFYGASAPTNAIYLPFQASTAGQGACLGFSKLVLPPSGQAGPLGAASTNRLFVSFLFGAPNSQNVGGAVFFAGLVPSNQVTETSGFPNGNAVRLNVGSNAVAKPFAFGIQDAGSAPVSPGVNFQAGNFEASNTLYLVVFDYAFSGTNTSGTVTNDHADIWVDPDPASYGAASAPAMVAGGANVSYLVPAAQVVTNVGGFYVLARSAGTEPASGMYMGAMAVGTTWSYVTGGPEFFTQPASTTNNGRSTVVLTSAATALAGQAITYHWQKNGVALSDGVDANGSTISGSATANLTIAGLAQGDGGSYTSVATDPISSASSAPAILTLDPNVTAYPSNGTVAATATTNLTVVASSSSALTYQWQRNGVNLTDGTSGTGTVYTGSQTAVLTLASVSAGDNGATYDCAVTNANGGSVITPPMTLTVAGVLITSQPVSVNTNYGATVSFSGAASPSGSYAYQWRLNGQNLANGASISGSGATVSGATTPNLFIAGVTYRDAGSYTLIVTGGSTASSAAAVLTVTDPYIVTAPVNQQVNTGSTVTFSVSAVGTPTLSYQWQSNGAALSDGGGVTGSHTASLTLASVTDADAGSYKVVVNGGSSIPASATATLGIFDPVSVATAPKSYTVNPGSHVAFVVTAAGTPPYSYQWELNGVPIAGATGSSLNVTNIQTTTNGTYTVLITNTIANGVASTVSASGTLTVLTTLISLPPTNLVVARVGDGAQTLNNTQGNTLYLDQFSTNGSYVATTMIPDSGPSALIVAGGAPDALYESVLTTSSNDLYLNFAGFHVSLPNANSGNLGTGSVRALAGISGYGCYLLDLTNAALFNASNQIRSATSTDGMSNFWVTGNSASIEYLTALPNQSSSAIASLYTTSFPDWRVIEINSNSGDLYITGGSGNAAVNAAAVGLLYFNNGAPTTASNPSIIENFDPTGNPDDFAISPDGGTIYIADDRALASGGGIQRFDGGALSYTLATGPASLAGARSLVVDFSHFTPGGSGAVIYATTAETATNRLIQIVDKGSSSAATVLQTAGFNQLFRGVRFGLNTAPVNIITQPQSQTNFAGTTTIFSVQVSGSAPFNYQWTSNGVTVASATNSTFVITNTPTSAAGTYSVTVNNGGTPVTSSTATLGVIIQAATLVASLQSYTVGANIGARVSFVADFIGSAPLTNRWTLNGNVIAGATNSFLTITNVQLTNAGAYVLSISNAFGHATGTATLTVLPGLAALSTNNLVISRVGDGLQTLNTNLGNTLFMDQYSPVGAYVNTTMIPDSGPQALVVAGAPPDGSIESCLTLSSNNLEINFCGFNIALPNTNGVDVGQQGNPTGNIRGIAALSGTGGYTLCLTNIGLFSAGNSIRAAASPDGLFTFWTTGGGLGSGPGIKYINPTLAQNGNGIIALTGAGGADSRVVETVSNNLFYTSGVSGSIGLFEITGNLYGGTVAVAQLCNEGSGSPNDFAVSPDTNTIYIADDSLSSSGGGIQRWDLVAGTYTLSYTLADPTSSGTNGVRSLAVNWGTTTTWGANVNGAIIYATTAEASTNRLISVTDNGPSSTPTVAATAYPNEVFRGIRFGPAVQPLAFASQPAGETVYVGQTADLAVSVTGSGPISYQWAQNGTNLAGATNFDLTFVGAQLTNAGTYTVTVNNGVGAPLTSAPAVLTVLPYSSTGNLAGWWKFNDGSGLTAADSSGNGNAGALTNFPSDNSEWVTGLGGMDALNFANINTSNNNAVAVADSPLLNFTNNLAFTIAAWIKTSTTNQVSGGAIMAKGYGGGGEQYALDIFNGNFRFYVRNSAGTFSGISSAVPPGNGTRPVSM